VKCNVCNTVFKIFDPFRIVFATYLNKITVNLFINPRDCHLDSFIGSLFLKQTKKVSVLALSTF